MHRLLLVVVASLLVVGWAQAQPLQAWDFEKPEHGWVAVDQQAELKVTDDPAHVYEGKGALQFTFQPRQPAAGESPGVMLVPLQGMPGVQSVQIAMQTSVSGPMIIVIPEKDESSYMYMSYIEAGDWHVVTIPLSDFTLGQDSVDENDALDLDQIAGLAFVDPTTWLMEATLGGEFKFFTNRPERRDLWIDSVQLLPTLPDRLKPGVLNNAPALMVENCDADSAYWVVLGGKDLKTATDTAQAARGASLRLDYELPEKNLLALGHNVRRGLLTNAKTIAFCGRATTTLSLVVVLEEADRSRYSTLVEVPGGEWKEFVIALADLKLEDDSEDQDQGLQPEKVTAIQFLDATPLLTGGESTNSLWIDEVRAQ